MNNANETPVIACSRVGAFECLEILLEVSHFNMKMYLDLRETNDNTAMHIASRNGHANIVKSLLARGASVDVKNDEGITPLRVAINSRHTDIIAAILADKSWKRALETGINPKTNETATESLIQDFPKMAEIVMDNCCYKCTDKKDFVFDVRFHEDFCSENAEEGAQRKRFKGAVKNPVTVMLKRNHENLYTHPLTIIHFRHEFLNYGIYYYIQRFFASFWYYLQDFHDATIQPNR